MKNSAKTIANLISFYASPHASAADAATFRAIKIAKIREQVAEGLLDESGIKAAKAELEREGAPI